MTKIGNVPRRRKQDRLLLRVRLLADPCLWCWEIHDSSLHQIVESSWTSRWMAYHSADEARDAGNTRLTELIESSRGADERGSEVDRGSGKQERAIPA